MPTKMQTACPKCRQQYSVADDKVGRTMRCPKCGATFVLSAQAVVGTARADVSTVGGGDSAARATSGDGGRKPGTPDVPAVIGSYQVRRLLGQGAFGVVYLAYHPFLDIEVAVKLLRAEALSSSSSVERFLREAKVLAKMDHPNVVRVYDAGKHGNDYYIASAYIAGKDLGAVVPDGGLEPRRAVRLALQMLRALGYAHGQGIVHRDVKPANARLNDQDTLFLMDFGLAGLAVQDALPAAAADNPARLTRAGAVMGTPAYMAPEQAAGLTDQAGPQADLYSAGVVLYELLTGQLPFEGANLVALLYAVVHTQPAAPSELRPGLDRRLDAICLKALAKRPEDRFRTAEEFIAMLEGWLSGQTETPMPAIPLEAPPVLAPRPAPARPTKPARSEPLTVEAVAMPPTATPAPIRPKTAPPPTRPAPARTKAGRPPGRRALWPFIVAGAAVVVCALAVLATVAIALLGSYDTAVQTRNEKGFKEKLNGLDPGDEKSDKGNGDAVPAPGAPGFDPPVKDDGGDGGKMPEPPAKGDGDDADREAPAPPGNGFGGGLGALGGQGGTGFGGGFGNLGGQGSGSPAEPDK